MERREKSWRVAGGSTGHGARETVDKAGRGAPVCGDLMTVDRGDGCRATGDDERFRPWVEFSGVFPRGDAREEALVDCIDRFGTLA